MGLERNPTGSHFYHTRNAMIAVFTQILSAMLVIIGIVDMRKSLMRSSVHVDSSADFLPWVIAGVTLYCLCLASVDATALHVVWKGNRICLSYSALMNVLHIFLIFCAMFFGVCIIALGLGYVVKGLGASGMLQDSDIELFNGWTAADVALLYGNVNDYLGGAWMLAFGAFLSIPAQGWLLSAAAVEVSILEARGTAYKPAAFSSPYASQSHRTSIPFYSPAKIPLLEGGQTMAQRPQISMVAPQSLATHQGTSPGRHSGDAVVYQKGTI
eukprot:m.1638026 g.1638026  ORF g.1638026 m.1638026 type:complete len:270 (-) comp26627_c0_seq1:381-1190(-)